MAFDPISWAADAGSSILNTMVGWFGQNHQNMVNSREAAKQRDWESAEAQKQRDFATEMWNINNAYNTPAEQRKRLLEAGYNPNLRTMQDVGNGVVTSPGSTPSGASASTPVSPQNGVFGSNVAKFAESGLMKMQRTNLNLMNDKQVLDNVLLMRKRNVSPEFIESYLNSYFGTNQREREAFDIDYENMRSEIYNRDMNSLVTELSYNLGKDFSAKERQSKIDNLVADTQKLVSESLYFVASSNNLDIQSNYTKESMKEIASRIAKNFADAFSAKKQGEYYEVSSAQMGIINKMLDLEYQDKSADFAFNTDVRKWKKDLSHRGVGLGLFLGNIGSKNVQLGIESNKFLQYGKAISSMVGDLFKVNFGISSNRTDFMNHTPQKGGQMFYSGDGYYLNNGVLLKGNW